MPLRINEIYKSIQGESSLAGIPCAFIRLTGCNLRCLYCDSVYAYNEGESMTIERILSRVKSMKCRLVGITGGEPLLQKDVYPLLENFFEERHSVFLETNGTVDLKEIDSFRKGKDLRVILDIKTPGSGMSEMMKWENLNLIQESDEVKFVISDRDDYDWAVAVIAQHNLCRNPNYRVLFSPVHNKLDPVELTGWILEDNLEIRLNLQLHKFMWGEDARGV